MEEMEEQDIGLLYPSRSGSCTGSTETIASRLTSRQPSPIELHVPIDGVGSRQDPLSPLKSPSMSNVHDTHFGLRPVGQKTVIRSRTLPRLPRFDTTIQLSSEFTGFEFERDRALRMSQWVLAFAIVNFDLDLGPVVCGVYPPLCLTPAEKENIAFSSFPDSLQFEQGSEVHSFRIQDLGASTKDVGLDNGNSRSGSIDGYLYGYSHFSQRRDNTSKRGYQQTSLVLLSHQQYPALLTTLIMKLGPLFLTHGVPMLETACHNIANWCSPSPGLTAELGFLGSVLHVELPMTADTQQLTDTASFREKFDTTLHLLSSIAPLDPPPISIFEASLSHLWSIWECLILCEPILVFGSSPAATSQAVWWLRDLLRPIPLANDFRPYFTIHDKDHSLLVNKLPPKAGLILGVTNPFFQKSCTHWPHVLSVGVKASPRRQGSATILAGPPPGWCTKTHRRYISKDRQLLKATENACQASIQDRIQASLDLRRHFCLRTNTMLVPLNRYLNTLIPSPTECITVSGCRRLKPFSSADFFSSLKANGSPLPFKSAAKRREFYERWLKTPAFGLWLAQQEEVVQKTLQDKWAG
ncbi:uncharacterized protein EDB91DRAFT_1299812 [Suillus paluster]|uniref:uncharacterized protein n=1 Tax=Suillus paluster TaxID=48578 RepID=UPI001B863131|nr:uncharacterized protein EDB91DRAFT_1299812 [Suillus paluster]KAG1733582.1 hypothetical protein EDB91DRAFT_1299812 [Suillus paluster]